MSSTSAIPGAYTHLLTLAGTATQNIAGAVVADGWTDKRSHTMFGVGADVPPFFETIATGVEGRPHWAGVGAKGVNEDFVIPCYIYLGKGAADNSTVRAAAFAIWDAFLVLLIADLSLGGALTGGRYAEIEDLNSSGPRTSSEAEGGRYCLITFNVHCTNLLRF